MAMIPAIPEEGRIVRRFTLASGETPLEGAAVYLVAGEVTICGADPASVMGFMAADYPGALTLDPYGGDVLVYVAGPGSTFWLSPSPAPTDYSNVGISYGVAHEATTEVTYVDLTDTTNDVVNVLDVDLIRDLMLVSVIDSVRQVLSAA
jgi:hypothetical protein